jgi:hypothetical protein
MNLIEVFLMGVYIIVIILNLPAIVYRTNLLINVNITHTLYEKARYAITKSFLSFFTL